MLIKHYIHGIVLLPEVIRVFFPERKIILITNELGTINILQHYRDGMIILEFILNEILAPWNHINIKAV